MIIVHTALTDTLPYPETSAGRLSGGQGWGTKNTRARDASLLKPRNAWRRRRHAVSPENVAVTAAAPDTGTDVRQRLLSLTRLDPPALVASVGMTRLMTPGDTFHFRPSSVMTVTVFRL